MDSLPATTHCSMGLAGTGSGGWGCGSCWDWEWWAGMGVGACPAHPWGWGRQCWPRVTMSLAGLTGLQSPVVPIRGRGGSGYSGLGGHTVCSASRRDLPLQCVPSVLLGANGVSPALTDTLPQLCPGLNPWAAEQPGAQQGPAFGVSLFKYTWDRARAVSHGSWTMLAPLLAPPLPSAS